MSKIAKFLKSEDGPTSVEYAILLALIITLLLTTIITVGGVTGTTFGNNASEINAFIN